ncbi:MAG TPA: hypothetical protein DHW02_15630, partial [Ktedonobacter sp.]|nr:hypothetical protein [Ktedonobacter sp.]
KPHYWEKTEHGLHLMNAQDMSIILEKDGIALQQHTATVQIEHHNRVSMPTQERHRLNSAEFPSVQRALNSIHNSPAAFTHKEIVALHHTQHPVHRDPWAFATLIIAFCIGIGTAIYNIINHIPTIASSLSSWSATLPMTNLITLPFLWLNSTIGNIGNSILHQFPAYAPVLLCYLVSSMSIFIAARSLTRDSRASFIGTLLFLLNPTLLSFNAIALNDWLSLATLTLTCCCFLLWMRHRSLSFLIGAAMSSLLATLTSYDGWALFVALLLFLLVAGWLLHQSWAQTESYLIAFGTLGALGVGLWIMLCGTVFGDPLAFLHATNASPVQSGTQLALFDLTAPIQTLGPLLAGIALLALALFLVRRRSASDLLAVCAFLVPFLFSVILALSGSDMSGLVPFASSPDMLDALRMHAGIATIAPASLFLATLIGSGMRKREPIS